jgi:hypothetical protein
MVQGISDSDVLQGIELESVGIESSDFLDTEW